MDRLSHLLPRVLKKHGLHGQATASLIVHRAQGWISGHLPEVAALLLVRTFSDGVLSIEAQTSIAAQECQLHAAELQHFIEKECGVNVTTVRVGRAAKRQQGTVVDVKMKKS